MRLAVATVVLLGVFAVPGPARANRCDWVEPVFGVKPPDLLIEHSYCVEGETGRFEPARVIATFENGSMPRIFWGGRLPDNAAVFYAVGQDGRLMWARQTGGNGVLGPMREVGSGFGDWGRYPTLMSAGKGHLFAVNEWGNLVRWVHSGWLTGADEWGSEPLDLGPACKMGTTVFASALIPGPGKAVVVQGLTYSLCRWDGRTQTMSVLPEGVMSATAAPAPGVAFALLAPSGQLKRMVLHARQPDLPIWRIDDGADATYARVFAGNAFMPGEEKDLHKYEWQWSFYDGKAYLQA